MIKIVLISCTKKKKDCRCAAWELYSARELFKKELVFDNQRQPDAVMPSGDQNDFRRHLQGCLLFL
jgi:hypothetical protein